MFWMSCCVQCIFAVRTSLRLAPNKIPRGGPDSHQSDKAYLLLPSMSKLCFPLWKCRDLIRYLTVIDIPLIKVEVHLDTF